MDSDLRAGAARPRGGGVIAGERVAHTELKRRRRPRKASRGKTDNWCVRAGRATLRGLRGSSLGLADCGLLMYLCFSAFQLGGGGRDGPSLLLFTRTAQVRRASLGTNARCSEALSRGNVRQLHCQRPATAGASESLQISILIPKAPDTNPVCGL